MTTAIDKDQAPGADPVFLSRLRLAGLLIVLGLGVEVVTLFWRHHLAFVLFLTVGGGLLVAGILVYLWSLLRRDG